MLSVVVLSAVAPVEDVSIKARHKLFIEKVLKIQLRRKVVKSCRRIELSLNAIFLSLSLSNTHTHSLLVSPLSVPVSLSPERCFKNDKR
jgi:hypothetical protein